MSAHLSLPPSQPAVSDVTNQAWYESWFLPLHEWKSRQELQQPSNVSTVRIHSRMATLFLGVNLLSRDGLARQVPECPWESMESRQLKPSAGSPFPSWRLHPNTRNQALGTLEVVLETSQSLVETQVIGGETGDQQHKPVNPKSSYERILRAPPCRLICHFHRLNLLFLM